METVLSLTSLVLLRPCAAAPALAPPREASSLPFEQSLLAARSSVVAAAAGPTALKAFLLPSAFEFVSTTSTFTPKSASDDPLPPGAIAGMCVGIIGTIAALSVAISLYRGWKSAAKPVESESEADSPVHRGPPPPLPPPPPVERNTAANGTEQEQREEGEVPPSYQEAVNGRGRDIGRLVAWGPRIHGTERPAAAVGEGG